MGQNQEKEIIKENKYTLKVNEELNNMLKEEVKPVKPKINKTFNKKATKFLKLSCKGKLKNKFFSKRDKKIMKLKIQMKKIQTMKKKKYM